MGAPRGCGGALGALPSSLLGARLQVPPGLWVLTHSMLRVEGPRALSLAAALDEIPILAKGGAVVFGQPPVESEWEHCGAGTRGWLGRAQHVPRCPQVAIWLPPPPAPSAGGRSGDLYGGGSGDLYEDDGWSGRYAAEQKGGEHSSWTRVEWEWAHASGDEAGGGGGGGGGLRVVIGASRGCLFASDAPEERTEPGLPRPTGDGGGRRPWRPPPAVDC